MCRMVRRTIKPRLDSVRYYFLCQACRGKIETTSGSKEVTTEKRAVVV